MKARCAWCMEEHEGEPLEVIAALLACLIAILARKNRGGGLDDGR